MNSRLLVSTVLLVLAVWTPHAAALKCYECSDADACAKQPTKEKDCPDEGMACFVSIDGTTVTRDCKAKTECTGDSCVSCDSDNCNNNFICKACTGGADCAQKDGKISIKVCAAGITNCYTKINADKQTERGCATSEIVSACTDDTCSKCGTGLCNTGLVPEGRLACNQCAASTACNALTDVTGSTCTNYVKEDKCYTYGTSVETMTRGCASDKDPKCTDNNENCLVCTGDNCNTRNFERDQVLKCIQCNSKTDEKCALTPSTADLKACTKKIKFTDEDGCYTEVDKDTVDRGCLYDKFDKASDCSTTQGCSSCTANDACNKETTAFQCITCRSDTWDLCWDDADKIEFGVECKNKTEPQKCFHRISDGVAMRGCLNDASEQVQGQCNQKNNCELCDTSKCNKGKSGATSIWTMNITLFIAIITFKSFF